ncbi:MAG: hypothetical protein V4613_12175 [Bacteroidota bacterium]
MKAYSLNDIRKSLLEKEPHELTALSLRMAKYKKENKELLSYLLFESGDEEHYIEGIKQEMDELFAEVINNSAYKYTKQIRKILRYTNKHIKYSGAPSTQADLLIYFCAQLQPALKKTSCPTAVKYLYEQQFKKIDAAIAKLHEDLQYDYVKQMQALSRT